MNDIEINTIEEQPVLPPEIKPVSTASGRYFSGMIVGVLLIFTGIAVIQWAAELYHQNVANKPWNTARHPF